MRFVTFGIVLAALAVGGYFALNARDNNMPDIQPAAGGTVTYMGEVMYLDRRALTPDARLDVRVMSYGTETILAETSKGLDGAQVPIPFSLSFGFDGIEDDATYYLRASITEGDMPPRISDAIDLSPITEGTHDLGPIRLHLPAVEAIVEPIADTNVNVQNIKWMLTELDGAAPVAGSNASITLDGEGRIFGNGGCNSISGGYTLNDNSLIIQPNMISTMMACIADGLAEQEHAFVQQLPGTHTIVVEGEVMTLTGEGDKVLQFAPAAAQPDAE